MNDIDHRLAVALTRDAPPWAGASFEPLTDTGLAHVHLRLVGRGALARIPKQSQVNLGADANLRHQAACFARAAPSGHTPHLLAVLPVSAELPRGGLIVEEIVGRAARLPHDLPAIAQALAAIHRLPMPLPADRPPLGNAADPLAALLADIEAQAAHLDAACVATAARATVDAELDRLRRRVADSPRPPPCLVSFDAHPGNFIVRADGRAVLVDLEKCRYSHAPLDLAHATLYTSTTWDLSHRVVLSVDEVIGAYEAWSAALGAQAAQWRPWQLPLRRAMWLWSLTWCAKWRAMSPRAASEAAAGEDWSTALSETGLIAHVRERVDHYLGAEAIAQVLAEFEALSRRWPEAGA